MIQAEKLTTVLEEIIVRWGIPGMGVGIVENEQIIYSHYFGVQSLETGIPVSPSSIFCVASVTKCFVACAVMQLVEQGKIRMEAPIVQYLPDFQLEDERYRQITIHQLLSHTSGMPDMEEREYDHLLSHPEYDEGALERYVHNLVNRRLISPPGERFYYSNIGYNVLGYLLARISGQTFEEYMKEHILLPSGMSDSTLLFSEVSHARLAVPHLRTPAMAVKSIYPYHRSDAPASFLHSTVTDMCHWAITCLNQGIYNDRRILTPASYKLMWTPVAHRGFPPFYEDGGVGWTLGHYDGFKTVSHGGMGFGWSDFLIILPEKNRAGVILCNEESFARGRTIRAVVQAMLDSEPLVGTISWMVPISRAIQEGGIQAAYSRYAELQRNNGEGYEFDGDDLLNLIYQLMSAGKYDLAVDVLGLNLYVFPQHIESLLYLANLHLEKEDLSSAEGCLMKILAIQPDNPAATDLLAKIRS